MAESEEELKSLLMKVKEESERDGSKLNIPKAKIMASNPITSQLNDRTTKCSLPHSSGYAFPRHLVFIFKTFPKQGEKKKSKGRSQIPLVLMRGTMDALVMRTNKPMLSLINPSLKH